MVPLWNFSIKPHDRTLGLFYRGLKTGESYLLAKIISKLGSTALCTYSLSYKNQNNSSVLSQIDYSASGQSLNPIKLYYGEGITDGLMIMVLSHSYIIGMNQRILLVSR